MRRPSPPLFLARSGYRRRRLHDAARLVPVFGAFLVFLPILWSPGETPEPDTARDGLYLFVVWAGLIGAAALLAPGLRRSTGPDAGTDLSRDPTSGDQN
jgi:uncharacterized membrane protein